MYELCCGIFAGLVLGVRRAFHVREEAMRRTRVRVCCSILGYGRVRAHDNFSLCGGGFPFQLGRRGHTEHCWLVSTGVGVCVGEIGLSVWVAENGGEFSTSDGWLVLAVVEM